MRLLKWVTPNQLTLARILAAPVLMLFIHLGGPLFNWLGAALFLLAGLTDYVDGELARQRGEVTLLGRMLDPIADKILLAASLVMLVGAGHAHVVPTVVIIAREFAVSGMRQVAALDGTELHVTHGAKWKTALQMLATGGLLLNHDPFGIPFATLGQVLLWAAAVVTVWTGWGYFRAYFQISGRRPGEATPTAQPPSEPPPPDEEA